MGDFTQISTKIEISSSSPWDVTSLYNFQFFCCPDCIFKVAEKQDFVNHAFKYHPDRVDFLSKIEDDSIKNVNLPWLLNEEKFVRNEEISENEVFDINGDEDYSKEISDSDYSNDENVPNAVQKSAKLFDANSGKNKLYCKECDLEEFLCIDDLNNHIIIE